MHLSFSLASSAFISHLYFSSELGCHFGPDFSLGPGGWGLGLPASPQLTGPGELQGPGCAPALETSSVVSEVSVQVDLLEGNLLGGLYQCILKTTNTFSLPIIFWFRLVVYGKD